MARTLYQQLVIDNVLKPLGFNTREDFVIWYLTRSTRLEASRETGIPMTTLRNWEREIGAEVTKTVTLSSQPALASR